MQVPIIVVLLMLFVTLIGFVAISLSLVYVVYKLKLAEKAKDLTEYEKSVAPIEKKKIDIPEPPQVIEIEAFP